MKINLNFKKFCVPFVFFADYNKTNVALFLSCYFLVVVLPVFLYCLDSGMLDEADK